MTYPFSDDQIKAFNSSLLWHLPPGIMRDELQEQAVENPLRSFEALVAYYAGDDVTRADIRAFFYAIEAGESWASGRDGPTSGELAEQTGQVEVGQLPENLVELCRSRLMPIVREHSKAPDVKPQDVEDALREMGIAGSLPDDEPDNDWS